jgi:putative spermidine/putrescine transport system permease protein/mannopine transport system permease protein
VTAGLRAAGAAARPWTPSRGYAVALAPPALFFGLFFLWPLARVVVRSVTEPAPGLANYVHLLSAGPYLPVLGLTVRIAAAVTAIALLVGYPVAYAIARASATRLTILAGLVLVPLWTSVVIRTYAWMVIFQRQGVLNDLLRHAGLVDAPLPLVPSTTGVLIGMVHATLPFMILPLATSMRAIDPSLLRAAKVLGARPLQVFLRVFLPLSMPGIVAGTVLVFITSLGFFVTPALLGGPRNLMAAVLIEQLASTYLNWPLASALATMLLAITTALYWLYAAASRRLAGPGLGW